MDAEIARLKRLLAAREGKPGYKAATKALKDRIANLEARGNWFPII